MRGAAERAASTWRAPTATRDGDARRGAGEDASHRADRAKTPRRLEGRRSILRRGVGALAGTIAMLG
ncbi:MAG: hypothetical protein KIS78_37400, partial [Labilithrix sp.]|nr:hypothetical protein [Labilithrix sp.]